LTQVETADVMNVMFQPMPSVVYLQNYQPRKTYEVPLLFRNLDVVTVAVVSVSDNTYDFACNLCTSNSIVV